MAESTASAVPEEPPVASAESAPAAEGERPAQFEEVPVAPERPWLWLSRADQVLVALLVVGALVLCGVHWLRLSRWGTQPVEIQRLEGQAYTYRIDINRATWVEWMLLENIGETLARRIVAHRDEHGPFHRIDDLLQVRGIGPKTLESLRPHLKLSPLEEESAAAP